MANFQITAPDGKKYRVSGENAQGAYEAVRKMSQPPAAQSPAAPVAPPVAGSEGYTTGTILPLAVDNATGDLGPAVPSLVTGLIDQVKNAVTAPGRAYNGELQVMGPNGVTPEAIQEGFNFATIFGPSALGTVAKPAATATRELTTGQDAALAAQRLGVDLPRSVASDSIPVNQMGKVLSNVPIGGQPLQKSARNAISQLDDAALKVQEGYGRADVAGAGASARQGIQDYSSNLDDLVSQRYDAVDNLVNPKVTAPLTATSQRVKSLLGARQAAKLPSEGSASSLVKAAIEAPGGLTYAGTKRLRTEIGQMLKNPQMAPAGTSQDELRALYGSLSDDLRTVVGKAGGEKAAKAFEDANGFAAKTITEQKALDKIIKPQADEGLFGSIQRMAGSKSSADIVSLLKVRKAVSDDTWGEITSSVISRMGRDADGNFTPDRFLTAYGQMSANGKKALFNTPGKEQLASSLEDITKVSRKFKELNQYANPSGTGQTIIGGSYLPALYLEPLSVVSTIGGTNIAARILSKPTSAKKLAEWAKAYERAAVENTPEANKMLNVRARVLALAAANDAGQGALDQMIKGLSSVQKVAAGGDNAQAGAEAPQQSQPPRMLAPNEL